MKKIGKLFLSVGKECIDGIRRERNRDYDEEWFQYKAREINMLMLFSWARKDLAKLVRELLYVRM